MKALLHESLLERYEMVYEGKKIIEISSESVVSDKMPDIGMLGDGSTHVLLRSKRTEPGAAVLEGELSLDVCYVPDGAAGLYALKMQLPWTAEFTSDKIRESNVAVGSVRVVQIETRMLNPRKILVKAKLEGDIRVYAAQTVTIYDSVVDEDVIEVRKEEVDCCFVSAVCERTFAATDEYPLPPQMNGAEILEKSVQFRIDDIKTLTNKLIIKGCVLSDVVLCSQEGETDKLSFTSAFSFIAETDSEILSDRVRADIMPTAMYYEVNANGRTLSAEIHGVCQMTVFSNHRITYLSDAYSNFYPCQYDRAELFVYGDVMNQLHREKVLERMVCRSQLRCMRFLSASHTWIPSGINVLVAACVEYENGALDWVRKQVLVASEIKESEALCEVRLTDLYGSCSGTELEFRLNVEWSTMSDERLTLKPLISIDCDEENPLPLREPSLTVMRRKGSLWELARTFRSTVNLIQMYNELEDDELLTEQILLIPRQRYK